MDDITLVPLTSDEASYLARAIMRHPARAATPNHPAQEAGITFHVTAATAPIIDRLAAALTAAEDRAGASSHGVRAQELATAARELGDAEGPLPRRPPGKPVCGSLFAEGGWCVLPPGHSGAHANTERAWSA